MFTKRLSNTEVEIPAIGLGTWNYHAGPAALRSALDAGGAFIDTAASYGTEEVVGEAIRGIREHIFIATKVSPQDFREKDFVRSAETSLRKLGIDVIDLLQLHEPNPEIPVGETMTAMAGLIQAGKVRFAGVSNFSVQQLKEAIDALGGAGSVVSNQVRYSLIDRTIETELLPFCQSRNIMVIAYSPLGRVFNRIRDCDPNGVIPALANRYGKSDSQIVLNWCIAKEGVVAIPKGNSVQHMVDNLGAAMGWSLNTEDRALLDQAIQFRRRGRFDALLRRYMPKSLRGVALRAMNALPKGIRRRVS